MKIFMNGRLVEESEAMVSVYDHGFLYGMGVFETFRTYNGRPYLLQEHLRRLQQGCKQLGILYEPKHGDVEQQLQQLLTANALPDAYFRYTVTAGTDILGLPSATYQQPIVIIYTKSLPLTSETLYERGKSLQRLRVPRNTPEGAVRLKSLHYMNNILGKREMSEYPWAEGAEGLFLDRSGNLCEGIVSNLFFVTDQVLYTPSVETGLLPGITREAVIRLADDIGLRTVEGLYSWDELLQANEVFMTNSIQEIVPIHTLFDPEGHSYQVGLGRAGQWTKRLLTLYRMKAKS